MACLSSPRAIETWNRGLETWLRCLFLFSLSFFTAKLLGGCCWEITLLFLTLERKRIWRKIRHQGIGLWGKKKLLGGIWTLVPDLNPVGSRNVIEVYLLFTYENNFFTEGLLVPLPGGCWGQGKRWVTQSMKLGYFSPLAQVWGGQLVTGWHTKWKPPSFTIPHSGWWSNCSE